MGDETSQNATVEFIEDTLSVYGKSLNCMSFMVSENTELNPCIARLLSVPLIGYMSHRLALSVNSYLESADLKCLDDIHKLLVI